MDPHRHCSNGGKADGQSLAFLQDYLLTNWTVEAIGRIRFIRSGVDKMTSPTLDGAGRAFMYGKLHRVTITGADLNYVGSITIDPLLLKAAGLLPHTAVDVVNITNGERLTTYLIEGDAGSGTVCLNGAAAHQFSKGDMAIIMGYEHVPACDLPGRVSRAVHVDSANHIVTVDEYITPSLDGLGAPANSRQNEVYLSVNA